MVSYLLMGIYFHLAANNLSCSTDYIRQGDQGQTHRRRSVTGGSCLENIKKTR